jgi:hypothetical protein
MIEVSLAMQGVQRLDSQGVETAVALSLATTRAIRGRMTPRIKLSWPICKSKSYLDAYFILLRMLDYLEDNPILDYHRGARGLRSMFC